jgi:hypothetical protein
MELLSLETLLIKLESKEAFSFDEFEEKRAFLLNPENSGTLNFAALERQRLAGSNTLKFLSDKDLQTWKQANLLISDWIEKDLQLDFEKIIQLNKVLCPQNEGHFRREAIFAAGGEFIAASELDKFPALLTQRVFNNLDLHPIKKAAQLYQWIVSFHPFPDGNGRTVDCCDRLFQNNYPLRSIL